MTDQPEYAEPTEGEAQNGVEGTDTEESGAAPAEVDESEPAADPVAE